MGGLASSETLRVGTILDTVVDACASSGYQLGILV